MVAILGDQFPTNKDDPPEKVEVIEKTMGVAIRYFYISIQVGGLLSTLVSPIVLNYWGPRVAFGIPAVLMGLATFIFWLGRNTYVIIPPNATKFKQEVLNKTGLKTVLRIVLLLVFMSGFFSLYDQNGSAWVLQAKQMDLNFAGIKWLESQIQAVNPILCIVITFLFTKWIYPWTEKLVKLTNLRKMSAGMFLMIPTFLLTAYIQWKLDSDLTLNIAWQLLAWVILTTAEVLCYATALEFFYSQAPTRMKSLVQAMFLLSVTLGNLFTAAVNWGIGNVPALKNLTGASYFLFFAGFMAVMTVAFIIAAVFYKEKTYLQDTAG